MDGLQATGAIECLDYDQSFESLQSAKHHLQRDHPDIADQRPKTQVKSEVMQEVGRGRSREKKKKVKVRKKNDNDWFHFHFHFPHSYDFDSKYLLNPFVYDTMAT